MRGGEVSVLDDGSVDGGGQGQANHLKAIHDSAGMAHYSFTC
jgi:hypothetical protein